MLTQEEMRERYDKMSALKWQQSLSDDGTGDWTRLWSLDGERGWVKNTPGGMVFSAGPVMRDDGCHAVLWTQQSFSGDLKVQFDYTRLDCADDCVNILYIQATGIGEGPYDEDIMTWQDLRVVPHMSTYFNNMNLLHVSYAANMGTKNPENNRDYVRARRYPKRPGVQFSKIVLEPSYCDSGLFKPGLTYRMTFLKTNSEMMLRVVGDGKDALFHWDLTDVEPVLAGRVGIRHMFTRCSRYANVGIWEAASEKR